jgi:hypothetical protein
MRQRHDSPTTEDIAGVRDPRSAEDRTNVDGIDEDHVDAERFEANGVESDRARHESDLTGSDRTGSDQIASDEAEAGWNGTDLDEPSDRLESGPVTVDETAQPADTTLAGQTRPREAGRGDAAADVLFDESDAARFRDRWREVQTGFVDDPKRAVQDADVLVAELMQNLASAFSERKRLLEDQWREGADAETEDLRLALRSYRSFLDQLLAH